MRKWISFIFSTSAMFLFFCFFCPLYCSLHTFIMTLNVIHSTSDITVYGMVSLLSPNRIGKKMYMYKHWQTSPFLHKKESLQLTVMSCFALTCTGPTCMLSWLYTLPCAFCFGLCLVSIFVLSLIVFLCHSYFHRFLVWLVLEFNSLYFFVWCSVCLTKLCLTFLDFPI